MSSPSDRNEDFVENTYSINTPAQLKTTINKILHVNAFGYDTDILMRQHTLLYYNMLWEKIGAKFVNIPLLISGKNNNLLRDTYNCEPYYILDMLRHGEIFSENLTITLSGGFFDNFLRISVVNNVTNTIKNVPLHAFIADQQFCISNNIVNLHTRDLIVELIECLSNNFPKTRVWY